MDVQRFDQLLLKKYKSQDQFCTELDIDPKSLRGWRDGKIVPRRASMEKVAKYFDVEVFELFPEYGTPKSPALAEMSNAWARRSESPAGFWWKLVKHAEKNIDLLGYAMQFLHEDHNEVVPLLRRKAKEGCRVRIVMPAPGIRAEQDRAMEQALRKSLSVPPERSGLPKDAIGYGPPPVSYPDVRLQKSPMSISISRFDDDMLVSTNLYNQHGRLAPLFHLHLGEGDGIFKAYLQNFDEIFHASIPCP